MSVIDPRELNDLAAFAGRGGLGYGVAMTDCVAEQPDQLMYLEGDSLVLLRDLGPILIASCEGVVGWVKKDHVRFDRLASSSSPTPSSPTSAPTSRSESVTPHADLPRTVVHSPSPPMSTKNLPLPIDHDEQGRKLSLSAESMDEKDKRASNPFELDSPLGTPGVESAEKRFELPPTSAPAEEKRAMGTEEAEEEEWKRESMTSVDSSNFGGIGGFMLGSPSPPMEEEGERKEMLSEMNGSPGVPGLANSPITPGPSAQTPQSVKITTPSSPPSTDDLSPTSATSTSSQSQAQSPGAWDIYDSYSRESRYAKRASTRQSDTPSRTTASSTTVPASIAESPERPSVEGKRKETPSFQSTISASTDSSPNGSAYRNSMLSNTSWDDEGRAFEAARLALQRVGMGRKWADDGDEDDDGEIGMGGRGGQGERVIPGEMVISEEAEDSDSRPTLDAASEIHSRSSSPAPPRPARRRPAGLDLAAGVADLQEVSADPEPTPSVSVSREEPATPKAPTRTGARSISPPSRPIPPVPVERTDRAERDDRVGSVMEPVTPSAVRRAMDDTPKRLRIANPDSDDEGEGGEETGAEREPSLPSATQSSDEHHTSIASIASTEIITPNPPSEEMLQDVRMHTSPERIERNVPAPDTPDIKIRMDAEKQPLLDSPVPMDESPRAKGKVQPMVALALPSTDSSQTIALRSPPPPPGPPRRPSLAPSSSSPSVDNDTPLRRPSVPWNPNSPASPHSVDATRQAVEAVRKTPESKRSRGMTLVGRMEADLSQSRGPVPITFLIGDSGMPGSLAISPPMPSLSGLGFPSKGSSGRISPSGLEPNSGSGLASGPGSGHGMKKSGSMQSTLASPIMDIDDPALALKITPSAYPAMRSATNPLPPTTSEPSQTAGMPKPGFFPRPRSRSFSAAVSKVMAKKAGPGLTIHTGPPVPAVPSVIPPTAIDAGPRRGSSSSANTSTSTGTGTRPTAATGTGKRPFFSRQSSLGATTSLAPSTSHPDQPPTPISPAISVSPEIMGFINNDSSTSLPRPPPSARSSSFSFRLPRGSKTSLNTLSTASATPAPAPSSVPPTSVSALGYTSTIPSLPSSGRPLPSPVSNKDYEDTVKADGLDFEIIQPRSKRNGSLLSPSSSSDEMLSGGAELERKGTVISSTSGRSLRTLPDTDEWGFIKDKSPTPEVFMGRAGGAGQRALEQKWLGIINTPLTSQAPKKVRKLAIESGIPASLRGRVWAWFMMPIMTARRPGLYQELLDHDREDRRLAERIDSDVAAAYPDHSIYSETSTGQTDLRQILRAYSHFATGGYRPEMSLIAGMLLIHCVAEDAFWLLSGFVNGSLRDYYASPTGQSGGKAVGMRVDAAVFAGVLAGSEPKLGKLFRDIGLHPIVFLEEWYAKLFLRCLPWPTALRIIDAVVAEGPRFLLIASLTILTLSRDRLLALPRTYTDVLAYLRDLPQDALLLPEGFMKACENVKFKEDDMKRMRAGVEKELGI